MGLVACSPAMALAAVLIRVTSPGPALFRQRRVGRFGEHFTLLKLRSMHIHNEGPQITAEGDSRVTPIGRSFERASLTRSRSFGTW